MQDYYNKYLWGGRFITKLLGTGLRNARKLLDDPKILSRLEGLSRSFKGVDDAFYKYLTGLKDAIRQGRVHGNASNNEQVVKKLKGILKYFDLQKKLPVPIKSPSLPHIHTTEQLTGQATSVSLATPLPSTRTRYLNGYTVAPNLRANRMLGARARREQALRVANSLAAATPPTLAPNTNAAKQTTDTLSARWQLARTWMNNHPKTTVGVPLLALGTGPGRYITGNVIKATQSDPANWFGEQPLQATDKLDFFKMPDGTKIPILRSLDGTFVPVLTESKPTTSADDLDTIIAEANNAPSNPVVPSLPGDPGYIDTSTINDLFPEDQW